MSQQSSAPAVQPVLSLNNVSRSFVDPQGRVQVVLQNLSLDVTPGESVALWGPSGSGKTTLLNLVAGLLPVDSGTVTFAPLTAAGSPPLEVSGLAEPDLLRFRREHVGYVFQFFNLIETLTVAENVRLSLELAGQLQRWVEYQPRLAELGLGGMSDKFPADLSGGEQQRVAVLRALAHRPELVLADEPTGNLDQHNSALVADLLWRETQTQNAALLIATHSDDIARRADRVVEIGAA